MLLILHGVISRIWKSSPRAKPAEQLHSSITSTSVGMKGWLLRFVVAAMLMAAAALFLLGR
jgi:hypothetical protein